MRKRTARPGRRWRWIAFALGLIVGACGCAVLCPPTGKTVYRVRTADQVLALTFDDGPNPPHTERLLEILREKGVRATFFLMGSQIEAHPETARRIAAEGHEVGNHAYEDAALAWKSRREAEASIARTDAALRGIGVTGRTHFRPPRLLQSLAVGSILTSQGRMAICADVWAWDWRTQDAAVIRDRVLRRARPGSIIVLQDGGGDRAGSVAAANEIIDALRARGFAFVTVSELLARQR